MAPKRTDAAPAPEYTEDYDGAIGIDLGTTYSCIAVWRNDRVEIISNQQGKSTTPSFVGFSSDGKLVGEAALNQISTNPTNTIYDAKRLIGRKWSDPKVQNDAKIWPFTVEGDDGDEPRVRVEFDGATETFSPQQISGFLLESFKDAAERHLGKRVTKAVVTVPAYFNDSQRAATKFAGELAGLKILRVINEPTAAALAYGLDGKDKNEQTEDSLNVLVFDLGGGTFDVSLINLMPEFKTFEVKATAGDTHLGGQDFDQNMVEYCLKEIKKKHKEVELTKKVLRKVRSKCEAEKKALSSAISTQINLELPNDVDINIPMSRAKFESLNQEPFERCMKFVTQVLEDAKISKDEVNEVVMVGGSSRIPKITQMVTEYFGKPPKHSINPDEAVAHGAAIQAHILSSGDDASSQNDRTAGIILIDVMPLSIGVGIDQGMMDILIPRNSTIPRKKEKVYSTEDDEQTEVEVEVFEGERKRVEHNNKLGEFQMSGINPGTPEIKVIFDVNADGLLTVTAEEVGGESKHSLDICNTDRANNDKIEDMLADAARFRKQDQEFAKKVRVKTNLESWSMELNGIVTGEKYGKLFTEELKGRVAVVVGWVEESLEEADIDELEDQMEEVDTIYEEVYDLVENDKDREAKAKKEGSGKGQKRKRPEDSDDDEDFESDDEDEDSESDDFTDDEEEGEKKEKKKEKKEAKPKEKKAPAKKAAAKKEGGEKKAAAKAPAKKKPKKEDPKAPEEKAEGAAAAEEEGKEDPAKEEEGEPEAMEAEGSPNEEAKGDGGEKEKKPAKPAAKAAGKEKAAPKPRAKKDKDAADKPKAKPKPKPKKTKADEKAEGGEEKPKAKPKAAKKPVAKKATPKAGGAKTSPKNTPAASPSKKKKFTVKKAPTATDE